MLIWVVSLAFGVWKFPCLGLSFLLCDLGLFDFSRLGYNLLLLIISGFVVWWFWYLLFKMRSLCCYVVCLGKMLVWEFCCLGFSFLVWLLLLFDCVLWLLEVNLLILIIREFCVLWWFDVCLLGWFWL